MSHRCLDQSSQGKLFSRNRRECHFRVPQYDTARHEAPCPAQKEAVFFLSFELLLLESAHLWSENGTTQAFLMKNKPCAAL